MASREYQVWLQPPRIFLTDHAKQGQNILTHQPEAKEEKEADLRLRIHLTLRMYVIASSIISHAVLQL